MKQVMVWSQVQRHVIIPLLKGVEVLSLCNELRREYSNASMVPSIRLSHFDLVNKPLNESLSNFAEMLTITRGWTFLNLEVRSQGHSRDQIIECILMNKCCSWEEDDPYWFCRSDAKGQGPIDKSGNYLVNTIIIEIKLFCVFWSNLAQNEERMNPKDYRGHQSK